LENVVERAVILAQNGVLRVDADLLHTAAPPGNAQGDVGAYLRAQEREMIEAALQASGGKVAGKDGAANRLGLSASTLEFRIKKLGIDKFRARRKSSP
jgi:formate hydrogenlyase transcriptional activator